MTLPALNRPLRICMVVPYDLSSQGGVKHHAVELARSLRSMGDQVTVIGPSSEPVSDPLSHTFGGVVNIPANGSDNKMGIFTKPWSVWWFFRKHRFDLIHVHEPLTPVLPYYVSWSTIGIPRVCTFHAFAETPAPKLVRWAHAWSSIQAPRFSRGIAVSEPAAWYATHMGWKRPLAIMPNGVRVSVFRSSPLFETETVSDRPVRLLFVGKLTDPRKGFSYLASAYRMLREHGVPVSLDVVGEAGNVPLQCDVPGINFHGAVPLKDLVIHYQSADIVVAPSTGQESFGIVLLEAMAAGKPLVCSDINGYRAVAQDTGAVLVPPCDSGALASSIAQLAGSAGLRLALGEKNLRAVQAYDWDVLAPRVRGVYVEALRERYAHEPARLLDPVDGNALTAPVRGSVNALIGATEPPRLGPPGQQSAGGG